MKIIFSSRFKMVVEFEQFANEQTHLQRHWAPRYYLRTLCARAFRHWHQLYARARELAHVRARLQEDRAVDHAQRYTQLHYFRRWLRYVRECKEERDAEAQKAKLMQKAHGWLDSLRQV
jgi:hypothetical protein